MSRILLSRKLSVDFLKDIYILLTMSWVLERRKSSMQLIANSAKRFRFSPNFHKRLSVGLLIALVVVVTVLVGAFIGRPIQTIQLEPLNDASDVIAISGGSAQVTQEETGVQVAITGAKDETSATVSSVYYGTGQPDDTGVAVGGVGVFFYDVKITQNSGEALGSETIIRVSITNQEFTSSSIMSYWSGTVWVPVTTTFVSPHTVYGTFRADDLNRTPIKVGGPDDLHPFVVPEYSLGGLLALMACLAAFVIFKKQRSS